MDGTSFGSGITAARGEVESHDFRRLIADGVPGLGGALWAVTQEQVALTSQVLSDSHTHESVRLLFNLAVNDLFDLLDDLRVGSGRSAMRASRALVEHAINMHTIVGSLSEASRYAEHLDQGPALALELRVGHDRLNGAERRAYLRSLSKVGEAARERFETAVAEHGAWFRRGWTQSNLRDRASRTGLDHIYRYYQLASLVTHGSAGGSVGTVRNSAINTRTFRTGPALDLAPVAMWSGLAGYREVLTGLAKVRTDIGFDAYTGALDALDRLWADYFLALRTIDQDVWPQNPVRPPMTVLAFTKTRRRRWYLHLPRDGVLLQARDPDLPATVEQQVARLIDEVVTHQPGMFRNDQRWITAVIEHVTVTPDDGGIWLPDTALLETPPRGYKPQIWTLPEAASAPDDQD